MSLFVWCFSNSFILVTMVALSFKGESRGCFFLRCFLLPFFERLQGTVLTPAAELQNLPALFSASSAGDSRTRGSCLPTDHGSTGFVPLRLVELPMLCIRDV